MNNGQTDSNVCLKPPELSEIKVQLKSIRNQVDKLLDLLDVNIPSAIIVSNDGKNFLSFIIIF